MKQVKTQQGKEFLDFGFSEARQRRGILKWILAVSVGLNILQFKVYRDQNIAETKVFYELIKTQMETKQKVDSSINTIRP